MTQAVRSRREQIQRDLELLTIAFPALFRDVKSSKMRLPLKLGIREDILEIGLLDQEQNEITKRRVDQALYAYTNHALYHAAVVKLGKRFGLDGRPDGEVDGGAKEQARKKLAQMTAKRTKKRRTGRAPIRTRSAPVSEMRV